MSVVVFQYKLNKYARWKVSSNVKGFLEEIQSNDVTLTLYSSHHLVVSNDGILQENVYLLNSKDRVQVLWHKDNLQIHVKVQAHMHKFRIKFASNDLESGSENCLKCCDILITYVTIKEIGKSSEASNTIRKCNMISLKDGNISINQMSKLIYGSKNVSLPLAYQLLAESQVNDKYLQMVVNLCLCDSNFPPFVSQIDKILKNFTNDRK